VWAAGRRYVIWRKGNAVQMRSKGAREVILTLRVLRVRMTLGKV